MKLKEIEEVIAVLSHFKLDENNNWRPDVNQALILLERDKLLRLRQKRAMKDNFEPKSYSY